MLALLIAAYGAVLSTVTALHDADRDKKRLSVGIGFAIAHKCFRRSILSVTVTNVSTRPVTVIGVIFKASRDADHGYVAHPIRLVAGQLRRDPRYIALPRRLEDGQLAVFRYAIAEVAGKVPRARSVEVVTAEGGHSYASIYPFKFLRELVQGNRCGPKDRVQALPNGSIS